MPESACRKWHLAPAPGSGDGAGWRDDPAPGRPFAAATDSRQKAKKNPNERFGFNPPKEEVEETAEVAELLQPMESII